MRIVNTLILNGSRGKRRWGFIIKGDSAATVMAKVERAFGDLPGDGRDIDLNRAVWASMRVEEAQQLLNQSFTTEPEALKVMRLVVAKLGVAQRHLDRIPVAA